MKTGIERALILEKEKLENKIKEYKYYIFECNPLSEIIQIRIDAQNLLKKYANDNKTLMKKIEPLAKKEKELFKLAEKQKKYNGTEKLNELTKMESELGEINQELYYIKKRKKKYE